MPFTLFGQMIILYIIILKTEQSTVYECDTVYHMVTSQ